MKKLILLIAISNIALTSFSQITYKKDWQGNVIAVDDRGNTIATQKTDFINTTG